MTWQTPWGYGLLDITELAPILMVSEFNEMTGNKYAGDERVKGSLDAACVAVRNYCGWHIYPSLPCSFSERVLHDNGRIKRSGTDILVQLPATCVSEVTEVTLDGVAHEDCDLAPNGILRLFDVGCTNRKTLLTVNYIAGVPDFMMEDVRELIAGRVNHALAQPYGVQSESAGGVSITYSASWAASASATTLPDDNKEALAPYRVRGVF